MATAALAMPRPSMSQPRPAPLAGVFPIAFTPVRPDDVVDFDGLAAQARFCSRGGVHGIAWPQIASGWTTLSEQERMQGADVLVSAARGSRTSVVIGVQSRTGDFKETARYAAQAEKLGAAAIICLLPRGVTAPADILGFYQQLGQVTSLPLFAQTGGDFSVDVLVQMFDTIPTFRYVKDEAGNPLERIADIRARTADRLKCFSGKGVATMMTEMERGFAGHCPYVSLADLYASAYDAFHAGNVREAFDQFGRVQAASSMFDQSDLNVLIARGVFRPGTTKRGAPATRTGPTPDDIKHILERYLKPYLEV
jgi:4-hydroxy-tetrahydrodipicolinate synthase/2-dehydro-3-deoxy-phosphogluconate/2-dehydro-3-deoxy-6-phosphogalactonate aldolase